MCVKQHQFLYEIVITNFRCDTKDANSPKEPVMDCPAMVLKKYVNMPGIPDVQVERYEDFLIRIEKELSSDTESDSSNEICGVEACTRRNWGIESELVSPLIDIKMRFFTRKIARFIRNLHGYCTLIL